MALNDTINKVRKDKGLSQQQVSKGYLSQSNYSKFENGNIEIPISSFIGILNNLNIGLEELLYIDNGYSYSEKEKIYRDFFRTPVNNRETLEHLILKCETFLADYPDQLVSFIHKICLILHNSLDQNDIYFNKKTAIYLLKIFSKKENLYEKDMYIINSIFFLFPIETAHLTMEYIETALEKYDDFHSINRLVVNLRLNYSLMLLKSESVSDALVQLEKTLPLTKKYKLSIQMGILYVRMGICYSNLNINLNTDFIQKGLNILEVLEENEVLGIMEIEILSYLKYERKKRQCKEKGNQIQL